MHTYGGDECLPLTGEGKAYRPAAYYEEFALATATSSKLCTSVYIPVSAFVEFLVDLGVFSFERYVAGNTDPSLDVLVLEKIRNPGEFGDTIFDCPVALADALSLKLRKKEKLE